MTTLKRREGPTRVIIYARMSTEGQDGELSLGSQIDHCRKLAHDKGAEIAAQFTDVASGGDDNRDGFQNAIKLAELKTNRIDSVLVYDLSRFTRNPEDFYDYYGRLKRAGVSLDSYLEPHRGDEMSEFFYAIITIFNSVLLPRIARYTRRGQYKSTESGYWVAPRAPFGYQKYYIQVGEQKTRQAGALPRYVGPGKKSIRPAARRILRRANCGNPRRGRDKNSQRRGIHQ